VEVQIAGRHVAVTEQMDGHIRERIEKLPPFAEKAQYVSVTLAVDSGSQVVEIVARSGRADLVAQASSHDMYQSIDEAFQKLERQLARQHDKLVHGRAREGQRDSK
jgi:putative sigma-54 modulation protein